MGLRSVGDVQARVLMHGFKSREVLIEQNKLKGGGWNGCMDLDGNAEAFDQTDAS